MSDSLVLYSYWRSSAAYRVRIALNLKGLDYTVKPVHLVKDGGQQHHEDYHRINPQELVPTLMHHDTVLHQSLAIIEYIDQQWPAPSLLPDDATARAQARALAQLVACEIHPVGNLRVLQYLQRELHIDDAAKQAWSRHWIEQGFRALEDLLNTNKATDRFCCGNSPSIADICLVPQVYNAYRWKVAMDAFPAITRIYTACQQLEAFQQAAPEAQPDAPAEN